MLTRLLAPYDSSVYMQFCCCMATLTYGEGIRVVNIILVRDGIG